MVCINDHELVVRKFKGLIFLSIAFCFLSAFYLIMSSGFVFAACNLCRTELELILSWLWMTLLKLPLQVHELKRLCTVLFVGLTGA